MEYKVVYRIEVNADSPLSAAKEVYDYMRIGETPVLEVTGEDGKTELIDLATK